MSVSSNEMVGAGKLFETVVEGGYCVGCGACASIANSPVQMQLDEYGQFRATLPDHTQSTALMEAVCPFSETAANEDQIGQVLFGKDCQHHDRIGYHLSTYAGFVSKGSFRDRGSSGGMGTWIVSELMHQGLVDGIIHVHQRQPDSNDARLFHYQMSTTIEQVRSGAKSRYYPIELSEVMQLVRDRPGRYAIVGIPCFIKAVRLLMRQEAVLAERIQFCIGLVCGHLKSTQFAEMFAWQCGIAPGDLLAIDFRKKLPGLNANQYGVEVVGLQNGQVVTHVRAVPDLYGRDWGWGFFKYKACDYCDDVVAETADIVVGDAWLPQYVNDSQGTNVVVVRHPLLRDLVEQGMATGQLQLDRVDADEVAKSQTSGFTHRRDGLAYRLELADRQKQWRPTKRVQPNASHLSSDLQKRYELRVELAAQSHIAFKAAVKAGSFSVFVKKMEPIVRPYRLMTQGSYWKQMQEKVKSKMRRVVSRLRKVLA